MGDPKKPKKKFETPRFPWQTDVLKEELRLVGQYGLRNKRELWRHKTALSKFRGIARALIGKMPHERGKMEKELLARMKKLGIIYEEAVLDTVLDLSIHDILERRLQTLVFRKDLSKSIYQARQLITHGHIAVGEQRVTAPSYLVKKEEESMITYSPNSSMTNPQHPLRKALIDGKAMTTTNQPIQSKEVTR